jgi:hypothetical protein
LPLDAEKTVKTRIKKRKRLRELWWLRNQWLQRRFSRKPSQATIRTE